MIRLRMFAGAMIAASMLAACSQDAPMSPAPASAAFAKSGTSTSGGGGTSGGTVKDTTTKSPTPTTTGGAPVAPSYTARVDVVGKVPAGLYYGTPSDFTVGGYVFKAQFTTSYKIVNGPIVVGACVTVNFYDLDGVYMMQEMKTVDQSKCG